MLPKTLNLKQQKTANFVQEKTYFFKEQHVISWTTMKKEWTPKQSTLILNHHSKCEPIPAAVNRIVTEVFFDANLIVNFDKRNAIIAIKCLFSNCNANHTYQWGELSITTSIHNWKSVPCSTRSKKKNILFHLHIMCCVCVSSVLSQF